MSRGWECSFPHLAHVTSAINVTCNSHQSECTVVYILKPNKDAIIKRSRLKHEIQTAPLHYCLYLFEVFPPFIVGFVVSCYVVVLLFLFRDCVLVSGWVGVVCFVLFILFGNVC